MANEPYQRSEPAGVPVDKSIIGLIFLTSNVNVVNQVNNSRSVFLWERKRNIQDCVGVRYFR